MQTYTGHKFWPVDPRPEEVYIKDIAHALSMLCRYNGHSSKFYSVAEHCVLMFDNCSSENDLWALLHDASEAYLSDVPRPLKPFLPGYKEAEKKVMDAICEKFGLPLDMPEEVHVLDNRILCDELCALMPNPPEAWDIPAWPLGIEIEGWLPFDAEQEFLNRFRAVKGGF